LNFSPEILSYPIPTLSDGAKIGPIAEKLKHLRMVQQRHRQTDDRQTTDGRLMPKGECKQFVLTENW